MSLGHYPQSFEYASIGGLRGDPVQRPVLGRLRALRRHGGRAAGGDAGRHRRVRPGAPLGRRTRPAPALPRFRGHARRDHVGVAAGPPAARDQRGRGVAAPLSFVDASAVVRRSGARTDRCRRWCGCRTSWRRWSARRARPAAWAVLAHEGPPAVVAASRAWARDVLSASSGHAVAGRGRRGLAAHALPGAVPARRACSAPARWPRRWRRRPFWSALPGLYAAVRDALTASLSARGTPPVVLCHVSHVYATGASLYFTVVCRQDDDPVAQWQAAQGGRQPGHPRPRRHDHPPPRGRHRPRRGLRRGDRPARPGRAAGGQGAPRPARHLQPGRACWVDTDPVDAALMRSRVDAARVAQLATVGADGGRTWCRLPGPGG
jgi:hypothetical protein